MRTETLEVLLVGPTPPPSGGVATHLEAIAEALFAHGARAFTVDPHRDRVGFAAALLFARKRKQLLHLHINGHNRKSWQLALLSGGARSILTVHSGLAPAYCRLHPRLVRLATDRYRAVLTVSPEVHAALAASVPSERLQLLQPFAPSLPQRIAPVGLRQIRRAHTRLFACALADGPEYGAAQLFEALALHRRRCPDDGTVIYGPSTRTAVHAQAVSHRGLVGRVHFLGELARPRALAVVAAADAFLRPTLADGDSLAVREALALRRPVIASRVGHRPPGVQTYPAEDPAALAELLFQPVGTALSPARDHDAVAALFRLYQTVAHGEVAIGTTLARLSPRDREAISEP
jgi:glycosyltransferase involved in cell wall biosynthesis